MMMSEFIDRTGFEPTAKEYAKIEEAYYDFDGDKDTFCSQIGAASEEIPVVVKAGMREIGRFRSLYKIPAQAMPGVLEAKITYVTMGREEIIIQVALKDYNTKL